MQIGKREIHRWRERELSISMLKECLISHTHFTAPSDVIYVLHYFTSLYLIGTQLMAFKNVCDATHRPAVLPFSGVEQKFSKSLYHRFSGLQQYWAVVCILSVACPFMSCLQLRSLACPEHLKTHKDE